MAWSYEVQSRIVLQRSNPQHELNYELLKLKELEFLKIYSHVKPLTQHSVAVKLIMHMMRCSTHHKINPLLARKQCSEKICKIIFTDKVSKELGNNGKEQMKRTCYNFILVINLGHLCRHKFFRCNSSIAKTREKNFHFVAQNNQF